MCVCLCSAIQKSLNRRSAKWRRIKCQKITDRVKENEEEEKKNMRYMYVHSKRNEISEQEIIQSRVTTKKKKILFCMKLIFTILKVNCALNEIAIQAKLLFALASDFRIFSAIFFPFALLQSI